MHLVILNNSLHNLYIIMYGSAHCVLSQLISRDFINSKYAMKRQCKLEVDASHRSSATTLNVK